MYQGKHEGARHQASPYLLNNRLCRSLIALFQRLFHKFFVTLPAN